MFNEKEITSFFLENRTGNKFSQNGEEIIIDFLIKNLNPTSFCVEFGASDGQTFSNTKKLVDSGWEHLLMDGNPKVESVKKEWITRENISGIFDKYAVPKNFGVLSLDIDGNDIYILESILSNGYGPSIIVAEFNRAFEPNESKTIQYNPGHEFQYDVHYGASLGAFKKLLSKYDYDIVYAIAYNLFAVKKEFLGSESYNPSYEVLFDFPDAHNTYKDFISY